MGAPSSPIPKDRLAETSLTPELRVGTGPFEMRVTEALRFLEGNLRSDPASCQVLMDEILPEILEHRFTAGLAWMRFYQGWLCIDASDFDKAMALFLETRDLFEELGNQEGLARVTNALGSAYSVKGIYDLALDNFKESAAASERLGRKELTATAVLNMADSLVELDEFEEALGALDRCRTELTLKPAVISGSHEIAGRALLGLGRFAEAEAELRAAITLAGGRRTLVLEARVALGELLIRINRLDEAEEMIRQSFEAAACLPDRSILAKLRISRARLAHVQEQFQDALEDITQSIAIARELGARRIEAEAEKVASQAWEGLGDSAQALEALNRHLAIKDAQRSDQAMRRIAGLQGQRAWREAKYYEGLYRQISSISEIGRRITADLDLNRILESVYEAVNGIMDAPTLMIAFLDESQRTLDYRLIIVEGERSRSVRKALDADTLGCWAIRNRKDVIITGREPDFLAAFGFRDVPFDARTSQSMIFVPLIVGDHATGVFSVQSPKFDAYKKQEIEMVHAIGAYIAVAIENARLFHQLQVLASSDALTGLLNRRRLTETIAKEFRKAKRYKTATAVLMVDIDHFKCINDRYGHSEGDAVIRAIAAVFTRTIRECDSVGRWGGEEFVLLLPGTGQEGALLFAERLREAIESLELKLADGRPLRITASLGVSCFKASDATFEAALNRADRALYRAKEQGRNRVSGDE